VRSRAPRQIDHLDRPSAPARSLDLHPRHFEVLQPEIDREIIPPVLVHPSDPPPFSQEERSWMNQDVSFRQAPPISSEPLSLRKSEKSRYLVGLGRNVATRLPGVVPSNPGLCVS